MSQKKKTTIEKPCILRFTLELRKKIKGAVKYIVQCIDKHLTLHALANNFWCFFLHNL